MIHVGLALSALLTTTPTILKRPIESHPNIDHEAARWILALCANEPFVIFPRDSTERLDDQIIADCAEGGFAPRVVEEAQEWYTFAALVAAWLSISIVPDNLCIAQYSAYRNPLF